MCRKPGVLGRKSPGVAATPEDSVILDLMDSFGGWSHFFPQMQEFARCVLFNASSIFVGR